MHIFLKNYNICANLSKIYLRGITSDDTIKKNNQYQIVLKNNSKKYERKGFASIK